MPASLCTNEQRACQDVRYKNSETANGYRGANRSVVNNTHDTVRFLTLRIFLSAKLAHDGISKLITEFPSGELKEIAESCLQSGGWCKARKRASSDPQRKRDFA